MAGGRAPRRRLYGERTAPSYIELKASLVQVFFIGFHEPWMAWQMQKHEEGSRHTEMPCSSGRDLRG